MSYEEQQAYLIRKLRDFTNPDTNKVTYYYEKVSAARSASPAADELGSISDLPIRRHRWRCSPLRPAPRQAS